MPGRLTRTLTGVLAAGLLATGLAACGGGDELSEADACEQYETTYSEFEARAAEQDNASDDMSMFEEYEGELTSLAEQSPDNLATLFESEAELMASIADGTAEITDLEASQQNSQAIADICG
ncbi:hypothetical protein [Georgenia sp. Z1491]|uniref:hypothetical protein n=1 Tax=Georgenia sp. Z1491 TaxID=3416707 RepID=UPI003CEA98F6